MTMPSGLLEWGQAGQFNAVDDRSVLAALFASGRGSGGLVIPPTLSPGSAFSVNLGPWLAVVDCGDGTKAVIGSRAATAFTETAGGASARADVVWADISPDNATWQLSLITEAQMVGRAGVYLGLILVPASASSAAAMDFHPGNARVLGMRKATFPETNSTKLTPTLHTTMLIPAYDAEVGAVYEIDCWGSGTGGSGPQPLQFNATLGSTVASQNIAFGSTAFGGNNNQPFRAVVRLRLICKTTGPAATWVIQMDGDMAGANMTISPSNGNFATSVAAHSGSLTESQDSTRDFLLGLTSQWTNGPSGAGWLAKVAQCGRVA